MTELGGPPSVRISVLPLGLPSKNIAPSGLSLLPGKTFLTILRNNILDGIFERLLFSDIQKYGNKTRKKVGLPPYDKSFFYKAYELATLILQPPPLLLSISEKDILQISGLSDLYYYHPILNL